MLTSIALKILVDDLLSPVHLRAHTTQCYDIRNGILLHHLSSKLLPRFVPLWCTYSLGQKKSQQSVRADGHLEWSAIHPRYHFSTFGLDLRFAADTGAMEIIYASEDKVGSDVAHGPGRLWIAVRGIENDIYWIAGFQ